MRGLRQVLAAILATSLSAACGDGPVSDGPASASPSSVGSAAGEPPANLASITGTISYRERIALTNAAEAVITLEDASRQDAPAIRLAQQTISDPGQVPIRFALDYPRTAIDPRGSYILRAHISDRGRLLFTTDTHSPVLTRGAGDEVHLVLVPVAGSSGSPAAMEGAYIEVERAYSNSGIEPGAELMIEVVGRYLGRPTMEGNHCELNLIVDSFKNLLLDKTCAPEAPHS